MADIQRRNQTRTRELQKESQRFEINETSTRIIEFRVGFGERFSFHKCLHYIFFAETLFSLLIEPNSIRVARIHWRSFVLIEYDAKNKHLKRNFQHKKRKFLASNSKFNRNFCYTLMSYNCTFASMRILLISYNFGSSGPRKFSFRIFIV